MRPVKAGASVPGPVADAAALWLDPRRWPAFVDGCATVARRDEEWPDSGRVITDGGPSGEGRRVVRARAHEPGAGHVAEVESRGQLVTQRVTFAEAGDAVHVEVELDVAVSEPLALRRFALTLMARRRERFALRRTLRRYAAEREADLRL